MKIFLDTADTQLIQDGFNTGLIDGVTTNPTLIMKSGRDPEEVYQELIDFGLTDTILTPCVLFHHPRTNLYHSIHL